MGSALKLKYGCNPHQSLASVELPSDGVLRVLNGVPSFINVLDALNGWQLVLLLALSTLKYTQSNSVVCATNGQTVGVGAGQQSRIDCTRIACRKSDVWRFRQHPAIRSLRFDPSVKRQDRINWRVRIIEGNLDAAESAELKKVLVQKVSFDEASERSWLTTLPPITLASDGYLPFPDNVREAHSHHVGIIAHPGGSTRDDLVTETCRDLGITLVKTGVRAFHH